MADMHVEMLAWLGAVWRRRWLALAATAALCALGWTAVGLWPPRYEVEARVYLDTDTLLGPLLRNLTVANNPQRRVEIMEHTLLTRPNLHQVMAATDLGLEARTPADEADVAARLRKAIKITAQDNNLFNITYSDRNPVRARDVVQALITILMESSAGQTRSDMEAAISFIEKQTQDYEDRLQVLERKMAEFKAAHIEELSGNGADFGSRLETARQKREAAQAALAEAQAKVAELKAQLRTVPQFLDVDTAPQVVITGRPDSRAQLIAQAQARLAALRLKYTDRHPDVVAAKAALAELLATPAPPPGSAAAADRRGQIANPVFQQIQLRLLDAQQAEDVARTHLAQAVEDEKRLRAVAGSAPAVEAEYSKLTRAYGIEKKNFEELLARGESARMSQAVQNTSDNIRFRVVEPPVVPVKPAGPNRVLFSLMVLVASAAAACGGIVLLFRIQQPANSPEMLTDLFGLPVFGVVSLVTLPERRRAKTRDLLRFVLASLLLLAVLAGVLVVSASRDEGLTLLAAVGADHAG